MITANTNMHKVIEVILVGLSQNVLKAISAYEMPFLTDYSSCASRSLREWIGFVANRRASQGVLSSLSKETIEISTVRGSIRK